MTQLFVLIAVFLAAIADAKPGRKGGAARPTTPAASPPPRQPASNQPAARPAGSTSSRPTASAPSASRPADPVATRAPVTRAPVTAGAARPVAGPVSNAATAPRAAVARPLPGSAAPIVGTPVARPIAPVTRPFTGPAPAAPATERWVHTPHAHHVYHYPGAHHWVPGTWWYRPYYAHWWAHPWYRWTWGTTVVVGFGFSTYAWVDTWYPPARAGWIWIPGAWTYGWWSPGYWSPVGPPPVGYAYAPGYWDDDVYVEGYYRAEARAGWEWVEGYYLDDGTAIPGHWQPTGPGPEGYVWEPGFFDGEQTVDGFWRPEFREDFRWVSSFFEESGLYHAGYWQPIADRPGHVWIPGWFDGNEWIEGNWVTEEEYRTTDPSTWKPEDGWEGKGPPPAPATPVPEKFRERLEQAPPKPLAIPVPS